MERVAPRSRGWARRFWDEAYRDGEHRRFWEDSAAAAAGRVAELDLEAGGREIGFVAATRGSAGASLVLDLGCGGGRELVALAGRGVRAVGFELSLSALAVARARGRLAARALRLSAADVTALPLPDGCVRLAIDRGCFHQLGGRLRRLYGAEAARVLAPGGRLVLWGARESSEEEGVTGLLPGVLEAAFPPSAFRVEAVEPVTLAAPAGDLPGLEVALRRVV